MTGFPANVPAWAALLAACLVLAGSALTFLGAFGLVRLKTFYERVHAPTLGATLGMFLILGGSVVYFTAAEGPDAAEAVAALTDLVARRFDEDQ